MINLRDAVCLPPAKALVEHRDVDGRLLFSEVVSNLITNAGRDFIHQQAYGLTGVSGGLNFVGLSNDLLSETPASLALSSEIAANGLSRAPGLVAHVAGTNLTTVGAVFTALAAQSAQKMALFSALSGGSMCHVFGFTQINLTVGQTLGATVQIQLG